MAAVSTALAFRPFADGLPFPAPQSPDNWWRPQSHRSGRPTIGLSSCSARPFPVPAVGCNRNSGSWFRCRVSTWAEVISHPARWKEFCRAQFRRRRKDPSGFEFIRNEEARNAREKPVHGFLGSLFLRLLTSSPTMITDGLVGV